MKTIGRYFNDIDTSEEERLEQEMLQEVDIQREHLKKYTSNIDSLLGKKYSSEVKKAMINYLVEQL